MQFGFDIFLIGTINRKSFVKSLLIWGKWFNTIALERNHGFWFAEPCLCKTLWEGLFRRPPLPGPSPPRRPSPPTCLHVSTCHYQLVSLVVIWLIWCWLSPCLSSGAMSTSWSWPGWWCVDHIQCSKSRVHHQVDHVSHLRVPEDQGEAEGLEGGQRPQGSRGDFSFYPLEPCERQKDDFNLS